MKIRSILRWTALVCGGVLGLVLLAGTGLFLWLRTSAPSYAGEARVAGLRAPVEIIRDRWGVPSIFAGSPEDAYFGLGFVHAQDRLWQMETMRRVSQGRLAETIGRDGLELDTLVRALDVEAIAARTEAAYRPSTRRAIAAYVAGVNAGMGARRGAPGLEFLALGVKPAPWRERDVTRLVALAALGYGDWRDELMRLRLAGRVGCDRLRQLFPLHIDPRAITYPGVRSPAAPAEGTCGLVGAVAPGRAASLLPDGVGRSAPASNSWAVDGARTATGRPMLASDSHARLAAPVDYYLARLEAPGFTLVGASMAGSPGFAAGHNGRVAWGVTDMMADLTDVFVEKVDPADPARYLAPGGARPFRVRTVTIAVKGEPAVRRTLRYTRHGPVVSDFVADARPLAGRGGETVAAVSGLDFPDGAPILQALVGFAEARSWTDFQAAARDWRFQQTFSFADARGGVGMVSAARLPIRRKGDGFLPAPGWSGEYDWVGTLDAADLGHIWAPSRGWVANANNALLAEGPPSLASRSLVAPYRARRIAEMLDRPGRLTLDDLQAQQLDVRSLQAAELLPRLRSLSARDEAGRRALALLGRWDGDMAAGRPEPLIYSAWVSELARRLLGDELGPLLPEYLGGERLPPWPALLAERPQVAQAAFDAAVAGLVRAHGARPESWRWGAVHRASFPNQLLSALPWPRSRLSLAAPVGGDGATVAASQSRLIGEDPFGAYYGARYRQLIDLADFGRSRFMIAPGVSENVFARSYGALVGPWSQGRYITLGGSRASARAGAAAVLRLSPQD